MCFLAETTTSSHELSMAAPELFRIGPLIVSNSMAVTWGIALILIVGAQLICRNVKPIPGGAQNFVEWIVEALLGILQDILGEGLARRTFWFFATIFIFIFFTNWFGLLPGVGTVGLGEGTHRWSLEITHPFLRGGNADLNMTAAMALVFFALWIYWGLQANGPIGMLKHLFGSKADVKGLFGIFLGILFFGVGILEVFSILLRPIPLAFRLYGNIFAGEVMLDSMMRAVPALSWIIPLPFYFLELMVGFIQALVFCLLTAAFTALMCRHDDAPGENKTHA